MELVTRSLADAIPTPVPAGAAISIANCRLFDGEHAVYERAVVTVQDDDILYAGPAEAAPPPPDGAVVFDAAGLMAMPGLIDVHNHSTTRADILAYAQNGVTTVRFAGLDLTTMAQLRQWMQSEREPLPRLLTLGPMLDEAPTAYPEWTEILTSPEQARQLADHLIVHEQLDGLVVTQRAREHLFAAVVDAARAHDLPVVGQTWRIDGAEAARAGVRQLENTSRIVESAEWPMERLMNYGSPADRLAMWAHAWVDPDWGATNAIIEAMVEADVAYAPTMVAHYLKSDLGRRDLERDPDYALFSEADRATSEAFRGYLARTWSDEAKIAMRASLSNREEWLRRFHAAGGTVVAGTDTQYGGLMLHAELRNLDEAGLGCRSAIRAATSAAADTIGRSDLGRLRAGCRADVLVVEGDPLHSVSACRRIRAAIFGGRMRDVEGSG